QVASAENSEPAGPRRVQIIPITPNGPVASGPPPESAPRPTIAVPGMVIDNSSMAPRAAPLPPGGQAQQPQPQRQAAVVMPQPQPPPRAAPAPQPRPQASAEAAPAAAAAPERRASVAVPKVPKNNDAFTPGAATQAATPTSGGNGFVAVLASQKSRMDALKVFADLQQRYGDVLSNKPADVQEANLGERGVFYRAVVGPPGSREAAAQVCTQLKAAGFNGCWVTAY
ncbi:MAG: SPOR domain-containing protein, partial [Hyphomicrobiales bacterium]|nr:SPOR domain-containing protein [Hyphomicrobiales bacterium]